MKSFIFSALFICQTAFASEVLLRDKEISHDSDNIVLVRDQNSPKEFFVTLKKTFVNRNVNLGCLEKDEVERTGRHQSCPPEIKDREVCESKANSEIIDREHCIQTAGQNCKMEIIRKWTDCRIASEATMGSCTYREASCVRYEHPTQERLMSVLVKFHRSTRLSKEIEKLSISLNIDKDGKTPSWEIKVLSSGKRYKITKKEGNRLFSKDPYYLISQ